MIQKKIEEIIHNHPVVIFIKGTKDFPMCGFSSVVVTILKRLDINFIDINVLDDPHIRQGIKDYSDWPTIPQLYIHGEFIGGCDITKELYEKGELQKLLNIM
jgi:monothiol glutaredoxin